MKRTPGRLLQIEVAILEVGFDLWRSGGRTFHGFALSKTIQEEGDGRRLTSHGTLYKALARLERAGFLESEWEDPQVAADEQRPRRRLYQITVEGRRALAAARAQQPVRGLSGRGLATE